MIKSSALWKLLISENGREELQNNGFIFCHIIDFVHLVTTLESVINVLTYTVTKNKYL